MNVHRDYAQRYIDNLVIRALLQEMRDCRGMNRSFEFCLAEARKQFAREVRAEADATPLTK